MFRVRPVLNVGRILHCMHRVGGFRFNLSIIMTNLRVFSTTTLTFNNKTDPQGMLRKFAFRAIHFHDFMKKNQGSNKGDLKS
jgi:hypothetical protein